MAYLIQDDNIVSIMLYGCQFVGCILPGLPMGPWPYTIDLAYKVAWGPGAQIPVEGGTCFRG